MADQTITTDGHSSGFPLRGVTSYFVEASVTNASGFTGALYLEASGSNGTHWSTIPTSAQNATADGVYVWNVGNASYGQVRLSWSVSGGTADLAASISGKGY